MMEACERLGGEHGSLIKPETSRRSTTARTTRSPQESRTTTVDDDRPRSPDLSGHDVEYVKVGKEQQARERQRMGFGG